MADYLKNHLCGSIYGLSGLDKCPSLLYVTKKGTMHGKRELGLYNVYCTAEGRCRSLGNVGSFTGNSPTFCPIRRQMEEKEHG